MKILAMIVHVTRVIYLRDCFTHVFHVARSAGFSCVGTRSTFFYLDTNSSGTELPALGWL